MSIGIFDADMAAYTLVPFNLTAMKLSAYYKKQREMVLLAKEFDPSRNKQFFYIKDWNDGNFPQDIASNNTTYLGHAFSGPRYAPLSEKIERMIPDPSIYEIMEKTFVHTLREQRIFRTMINGEHCRLSLDGKTLWPQYMCQFRDLEHTRHIMIHDYDLAQIDGAIDAVKNIMAHTKRQPTLGLKFAPHLTDPNDLLGWSQFRANEIFYSMAFDGVLPNDIFYKWCAMGKSRATYAALEYNITPASSCQNDFTEDLLRQIFRQVIISRSYRLKMTLIYDDEILVEQKLRWLINLFNFYQHSMQTTSSESGFIKQVQNDTLFDFAKKSLDTYGKYPKMLNRWDMRALFHWAQENYPTLFREFYELSYIKVQEEME